MNYIVDKQLLELSRDHYLLLIAVWETVRKSNYDNEIFELSNSSVFKLSLFIITLSFTWYNVGMEEKI